jgi:transposase InsO family protein
LPGGRDRPLHGLEGRLLRQNAVVESFLKALKAELVHRRSWQSKSELRGAVFEYGEGFYNRTRRHSTLGYLSPAQEEHSLIGGERERETA